MLSCLAHKFETHVLNEGLSVVVLSLVTDKVAGLLTQPNI